MARLQARYVAIQRKKVNYLTGRQLYLKELNEEACSRRAIDVSVAGDVSGQIMMKHGARSHSMATPQRQDYEVRAVIARQEKTNELEVAKESLRSAILKLEEEIRKDVATTKPLRHAHVKLREDDKVEIEGMWDHKRFAASSVTDAMAGDGRTLEAPGDIVRQALENIALDQRPKAPRPSWLGLLCWNRRFFVQAILRITEPSTASSRCYKYVLGLQSPYLVALLFLIETVEAQASVDAVGYLQAQLLNFDHTFTYNDLGFHFPMTVCGLLILLLKCFRMPSMLAGTVSCAMEIGGLGKKCLHGFPQCQPRSIQRRVPSLVSRKMFGLRTHGWHNGLRLVMAVRPHHARSPKARNLVLIIHVHTLLKWRTSCVCWKRNDWSLDWSLPPLRLLITLFCCEEAKTCSNERGDIMIRCGLSV